MSSNLRITRHVAIGLVFLAVLTDGFDTAILALLVPHLAEEWGLKSAAFTYPLVLTNVGVVVGYLCCGSLAKRFGHKRLLTSGVALFGVATLGSAATLHWESMSMLAATRTLTGLGLGIVLPVAVIVGAQNGPAARRQLITVFVTMGLISGATIAGFVGAPLIGAIGTHGALWLTGVIPLVLACLLGYFVPATSTTAEQSSGPEETKSTTVQILGSGIRTSTLLLWGATFLTFLVSYTLKSWLPTLFGDYGLSRSTAGLGLAFFSLGGVAGGLVLMAISAKVGTVRALVAMSMIAAVAVIAVAKIPMGTVGLMSLITVAGLGITACSIGQTATAVAIYEESARTTGVGWSAALGRIGSIVGPAIAGILLGFAWPAQDIVLLLAVPILVTTGCWLLLSKRTARDATSSQPQKTVSARIKL
ncbi:MFS transporter [Rhodococcus qingshengii]|uniref:MFS transporter n=1 Tax=Rhodococcus qingshengii TaxID=334542 RepID=UPI00287F939E|nr:MFS transporter [Rhodococcus qingshengii]